MLTGLARHWQNFMELMAFVDHKDRCDFVQPMWHKGPCDCGLFALFEKWQADDPPALVVGSEAYQRWLKRGEHER